MSLPDPLTLQDAMVALLSQETFGAAIRQAVRALFFGVTDEFQFQDQMIDLFNRYFEQAWTEGAATCGILPEEQTGEEASRLNAYIFEQASFLPNYAAAITQARQAAIESGDLDPEDPNTRARKGMGSILNRASMWENRWGEVKALGQQMACEDQKSRWKVNPMKEHCEDCARVDGKVYRNSTWARHGWAPRSSALACTGRHCGCELVPTSEPATPGRPPMLVGG